MGRAGKYIQEARQRAQRRKSPWNLLLFALVFFCVGGVYYLFWHGLTLLQRSGIPDDAMLWTYTWGGGFLMYLLPFFPSIPIGMMFANFLAWLVPPARRAFDREAGGVKYASFRKATRHLSIASAVLLLLTLPFSLAGSQSYYYVTERGVVSHSLLGSDEYGWTDTRQVRIVCCLRGGSLDLQYVLTFDDGTEVDLWYENTYGFLRVYDRIFARLQENSAIVYEQEITDGGLSAVARTFSAGVQARMNKVFGVEFIDQDR